MRRIQAGWAEAVFTVEGQIVQAYVPYVLVRCTRYTNGRRQAQQIGAYTLVTACLLARELGHALPFGTVLETVLRVVGPDVLRGAEGEDWRDGPDEPLLADPWMRHMATALNALKRRGREALLLHQVGGLPAPELARLLEQPPAEVLARLRRARRHLARWLGRRDVPPLLARFAAGLDAVWMQEVAACALEYLTTCGRRRPSAEIGEICG